MIKLVKTAWLILCRYMDGDAFAQTSAKEADVAR